MAFTFLHRDLSWLSFNGRVLLEAAGKDLPVLERLQFLSIFSSNLDEFYRVRIPALMALSKIEKDKGSVELEEVNASIRNLQDQYGELLKTIVIPELAAHHYFFIYDQPIPDFLLQHTTDYFFTTILSFLEVVKMEEKEAKFFPGNNVLYLYVGTKNEQGEETYLVNIPGTAIGRFFSIAVHDAQYVCFIDDIIKANLPFLFPGKEITEVFSFKVTRDAELDLEDEYRGDLAEKIEKQIARRDFGFATRFLHEPQASAESIVQLIQYFGLTKALLVKGGRYHHLRDLGSIPIKNKAISNTPWPAGAMQL
ncbi:MAG: polyphosphate kinase 1, partial [Chryseobacterium sp.]